MATASLGCGGKAQTDAFVEGTGGSGAGGSSQTEGTGGVSSTALSVTNGPSTSTTGTPTPAERCLQPIESGSCEAYFPSFGYNTETERCEEFVYGGCDGNDNRFESLDACLAACDPNGNKACEVSTDCVIDHGCCGLCGLTDGADLVAVNQKYASFLAPECELAECEACRRPEAIGTFGARCNAGTCEIFDIATNWMSECTSDDQCLLRAGVECCDGCNDPYIVSYSVSSEELTLDLCGSYTVHCDCEQSDPSGPTLTSVCRDGHCATEPL